MTTPANPLDTGADRDRIRRQRAASSGPYAAPRNVTKTRTGGGFNPSLNPTVNISMSKGDPRGAADTGAGASGGAAAGGKGTPGADFMSNEDIRAFSEHVRKQGRNRAVERAMDAEQLEAVLRTIPDATGSMAGARMRARRVSRHLKKIAKAEQVIAKYAAALYAQFEREYEAELRAVSKARPKPTRAPFRF